MLVIIKYSKRKLKIYLGKCIAFFLFIFGILSIPLLSVVLIMPREHKEIKKEKLLNITIKETKYFDSSYLTITPNHNELFCLFDMWILDRAGDASTFLNSFFFLVQTGQKRKDGVFSYGRLM